MNEFPTPETVDILAEVSEHRTGRNIGWFSTPMDDHLKTVRDRHASYEAQRAALVRLAAHCIARIELMDKGKI